MTLPVRQCSWAHFEITLASRGSHVRSADCRVWVHVLCFPRSHLHHFLRQKYGASKLKQPPFPRIATLLFHPTSSAGSNVLLPAVSTSDPFLKHTSRCRASRRKERQSSIKRLPIPARQGSGSLNRRWNHRRRHGNRSGKFRVSSLRDRMERRGGHLEYISRQRAPRPDPAMPTWTMPSSLPSLEQDKRNARRGRSDERCHPHYRHRPLAGRRVYPDLRSPDSPF